MKKSIFLPILFVLLSFASVSPVALAQGESSSGDLACPENFTGDVLTEWRKSAVGKAVNGEYGKVKSALKTCFPNGAPACTQDLDYYVKLKSNRPQIANGSDSYGDSVEELNVAPAEGYILESEKDLPKEFLVKDSNGRVKPGFVKFPDDVLKVAKDKGWKAVGYKTRGTGGFDSAPNLSIVAIPGREKDIFLQISPPPDRNRRETRDNPYPASKDFTHGQDTLTIISVDKTKKPPVAQLRLLRYDDQSGGYKWHSGTRTESCTQCHTTPLRSISPRGYLVTNGTEQRMKPEDERMVTEINDMMLVPGLTWGKAKATDGSEIRRGPRDEVQPYGWAPPGSRTRKPDFLKACATTNTQQSYQSLDRDYTFQTTMSDPTKINHRKVGQTMNCVQCHDGSVRGYLHENFSFDEIKFKILVDRSMPPGLSLTMDERMALVNCLQAEFQELRNEWKKKAPWLTRGGCEDMPTAGRAGSGSGSGSPQNNQQGSQ
ncbi:hypothetical protein [Bdellovibrio sp. HCB337]|uniref:hypothetical protein n=1 Tax=Bdellovibrio sp. HCB337 TaxID=3394358 RepID=UPI0039A4EDED